MKQKVLLLAVLMIGGLCFLSCGQRPQGEYEKKIVGKWHFGHSQKLEEGLTMAFEFTTDYRADKTAIYEGFIRLRVEVEDEDYANNLTFEYSISGESTWDVEGDYFIEKGNRCDIELKKASAMVEMEDNDFYIEMIKEKLEDFIPELRSSLLKKSKDKIIKLNDTEFSIEDEDGETETYTRIE